MSYKPGESDSGASLFAPSTGSFTATARGPRDETDFGDLLRKLSSFSPDSDDGFDNAAEAEIAAMIAAEGSDSSSDEDEDQQKISTLAEIKRMEVDPAQRPQQDVVSSLPLTKTNRAPPPSVLRVYKRTFEGFAGGAGGADGVARVHIDNLADGLTEVIQEMGVGSQDGYITFEEFVDIMERIQKGSGLAKGADDDDADMEAVVREMDGLGSNDGMGEGGGEVEFGTGGDDDDDDDEDDEDPLMDMPLEEREPFLRTCAQEFDRISEGEELCTVDQVLMAMRESTLENEVDKDQELEFHFTLIAASDRNDGMVDFDQFCVLMIRFPGVIVPKGSLKTLASQAAPPGDHPDGQLMRTTSGATLALQSLLEKIRENKGAPNLASVLEKDVNEYVDMLQESSEVEGGAEEIMFKTLQRMESVDTGGEDTPQVLDLLVRVNQQREMMSAGDLGKVRVELKRVATADRGGRGGLAAGMAAAEGGLEAAAAKPKVKKKKKGFLAKMKQALEDADRGRQRMQEMQAAGGAVTAAVEPEADPEPEPDDGLGEMSTDDLIEIYLQEMTREDVIKLTEKMERKLEAKEVEYAAMKGYLVPQAIDDIRQFDRKAAEEKLRRKIVKKQAIALLEGRKLGIIPKPKKASSKPGLKVRKPSRKGSVMAPFRKFSRNKL